MPERKYPRGFHYRASWKERACTRLETAQPPKAALSKPTSQGFLLLLRGNVGYPAHLSKNHAICFRLTTTHVPGAAPSSPPLAPLGEDGAASARAERNLPLSPACASSPWLCVDARNATPSGYGPTGGKLTSPIRDFSEHSPAFPANPHESASHAMGYEHAPDIVGTEGRIRRRCVTPTPPAAPWLPGGPRCQSPL